MDAGLVVLDLRHPVELGAVVGEQQAEGASERVHPLPKPQDLRRDCLLGLPDPESELEADPGPDDHDGEYAVGVVHGADDGVALDRDAAAGEHGLPVVGDGPSVGDPGRRVGPFRLGIVVQGLWPEPGGAGQVDPARGHDVAVDPAPYRRRVDVAFGRFDGGLDGDAGLYHRRDLPLDLRGPPQRFLRRLPRRLGVGGLGGPFGLPGPVVELGEVASGLGASVAAVRPSAQLGAFGRRVGVRQGRGAPCLGDGGVADYLAHDR